MKNTFTFAVVTHVPRDARGTSFVYDLAHEKGWKKLCKDRRTPWVVDPRPIPRKKPGKAKILTVLGPPEFTLGEILILQKGDRDVGTLRAYWKWGVRVEKFKRLVDAVERSLDVRYGSR